MSEAPHITYGPWLPTCYLRWATVPGGARAELQQKMRRKVKRDWGGIVSKATSYDYEWQYIAVEAP